MSIANFNAHTICYHGYLHKNCFFIIACGSTLSRDWCITLVEEPRLGGLSTTRRERMQVPMTTALKVVRFMNLMIVSFIAIDTVAALT